MELTPHLVLQLVGQTLITAVLVAGPILGLTLLVGLLISVLQVVTQVQEMSLTFIPEVITVVLTMIVLAPWMLRKLLSFALGLLESIPGYF